MADWSKLPYDLIHKVATYLVNIEDFLAFSAVCCPWRSVYLAKEWHPQVPLLMVTSWKRNGSRDFISLYKNKAKNIEVPNVLGRKCWASCSGWILTLGEDLKIHLLNPLTRVSVSLPPLSSLQIRSNDVRIPNWSRIIKKAFVFKKPCSEGDSLVMIICGPLNQLAFCRPGYTSWTSVKATASRYGFIDVAFAKDQIFALSNTGSLFVIDIDGAAAIDINGPPRPKNVKLPIYLGQLLLVESSGDLCMVYRVQGRDRWGYPIGPVQFFVYSFDFINKKWIELRDIGNQAIFVGVSGCVSVCGPERFNCRSDSIYFVELDMKNWMRTGREQIRVDLRVYNVIDRVSETHCFSPGILKYESYSLWLVLTLG